MENEAEVVRTASNYKYSELKKQKQEDKDVEMEADIYEVKNEGEKLDSINESTQVQKISIYQFQKSLEILDIVCLFVSPVAGNGL